MNSLTLACSKSYINSSLQIVTLQNDFSSYEMQEGHHLKNIFSYMEDNGALDPDDEIDLAALE